MRLSGTKTGSANQYCGLGNQLYDLAGSRPSLDLRFAESKSLNDSITGSNLITFTRSSTATYYDSNGVIQTASNDTPRFDHDPVTGECLGLLIENNRTNLVSYSNAVLASGWSNGGSDNPTNLSLNKLGVFDGLRVTSNGGESQGIKNNASNNPISLTAGTTYAFSIWFMDGDVNPAGKVKVIVKVNGVSGSAGVSFSDITDISAYSSSNNASHGDLSNISLEDAGDSVYKLTFNYLANATNSDFRMQIGPNSSTSGESIIFLGAQVEEGVNPSSYIPTNGSTATRSTDVANITGTNFSSWYGNNEGTVFSENIYRSETGTTQFAYAFSDGAIADEIYQYKATGNDNVFLIIRDSVDGTTFNQNYQNAMPYGRQTKSALAFASNNAFSDLDDLTTKFQDNNVTVPVLNQVRFAERVNGQGSPFLTINRFTYWPSRLPNDTLGTITKQF